MNLLSFFYDKYLHIASAEENPIKVYEAADYVGWYLSTKGSWQKAYKYYELVYKLRPDSARAVSNYCNALFNVHRYDEAIAYCNEAIELDSDHPWSYYILSKTYERKGSPIPISRCLSTKRYESKVLSLPFIFIASFRLENSG
ncbi:hypothetical protein AB835_03600 [Candidatus Endobugula sertula]|uniref:Uncharacterized protein n=1 Tax=Candidatus Endobugula sertula TaxID=62101 RepID=A0A1D2QS36_9GAMM|nr:hypothetical protein AB835_03600 [Candidatus Endobugula sertula]